MLITPTLIPPPPVSWAASALRNPHPGAQTLPVSHNMSRGSWLVGEGDVTDVYVCHFDSMSADQCVRCKRMQAVKKINQYFSRGAILHTFQYPRALLYIHGTLYYHTIHGPSTVCCYYCNTAKYAHSVVAYVFLQCSIVHRWYSRQGYITYAIYIRH